MSANIAEMERRRAAAKMGGEVTVLVAGHQCAAAAQAAAKVEGVKKVLLAERD